MKSRIRGVAVLALAWVVVLSATVSAEEPAGPSGVLESQKAERVSYVGQYTPDGRHFVYPILHKKGDPRSELQAMEVATGKVRSLGFAPIDPAKLGGGRRRGGTPYVAVLAVTNDLEWVFLSQPLLAKAKGKYLAWRTSKKALVPLDTGLSRGRYLGTSGDGTKFAFQTDRSPVKIVLLDKGEGKAGTTTTLELELPRSLAYRTMVRWVGDALYAFTDRSRAKDGSPGTAVRKIWPDKKKLGVVPPVTLTLRTGAGAVKPVACAPLFCGRPGGGKALVFFRGDEVIAAKEGGLDKPTRLAKVTSLEVPDRWNPRSTVDAANGMSYTGTIEVKTESKLNYMSYLPAKQALGDGRKVILKLAVRPVDAAKTKAADLAFDLTSLFDPMRKQALADYQQDGGQKSSSGVLTRHPRITALGARDGKVFLLFRFRVWYGVRGMDYVRPLLVDTLKKEFRTSQKFADDSSSGLSWGPPSLVWRMAPDGRSLALIWNEKLQIFRSKAK